MKTLFLVLLLAVAANSQQAHAPLPEQCKADYAIWHVVTKEQLEALPFVELNGREVEMFQCGLEKAAYSSAQEDYGPLSLIYTAKKAQRYEFYLRRHNQFHQFLIEDAAKAGVK